MNYRREMFEKAEAHGAQVEFIPCDDGGFTLAVYMNDEKFFDAAGADMLQDSCRRACEFIDEQAAIIRDRDNG